MKHNKIAITVTLFVFTAFVFQSCKKSATTSFEESYQPSTPISRNLSPYQIMKMEGITSLHYTLYDSSASGTKLDSTFTPLDECFIDSSHSKLIEYLGNNHSWYISVYDMKKNVAWSDEEGVLTYIQIPSVQAVVEADIQFSLGSSLKLPATYLRSEYVGNKLCDVFEDSTGYQEWIWTEHLLPIQARNVTTLSINTIRKIIIEMNIQFPDSVFNVPH